MTPTSDNALEIGCVWTTRLTALTTARNANTKKRIASIFASGKNRDEQAGQQQVHNRDREQKCPRQAHQLVVTIARQRGAHPDKHKQQEAGFGPEPEQRNQNLPQERNQKDRRDTDEHDTRYGKRVFIHAARRLKTMIESNESG